MSSADMMGVLVSDKSAVIAVPATEPATARVRRRRFERLRAIGLYVGRLSPYGVVFGTYGVLIDELPGSSFSPGWLRNVFAAVVGVLAGLVVMTVFQRPAVRGALTPQEEPAARALPAAGDSRQAAAPRAESVHDILAGTRERLLAELRDGRRGAVAVRGWPQFLDDAEKPPGAVGSAYGLRLAQVLDVRDARLDTADVVRSVLEMQRPGGGWAARAQRSAGARPEITAFVLPALVRAGLDTATHTRLAGVLEYLLDPAGDPGLAVTTVITSALCALADVAPGSPRLAELANALDRGAQVVPGGAELAVAWGLRCDGRPHTPSVPHTARAVVALYRAAQVGDDLDGRWLRGADAGAAWLRAHADHEYLDEQVHRPEGDDTDQVVVGHFTPAWVARALFAAGDGAGSQPLAAAVAVVRDSQRDGIWRRNNDLEPIWMTYQGVAVLREYALRNLPWPPR
jgi:hypothetical protein